MDAALRSTVLLGVTTNVRFLLDVLAHPVFQRGEVATNFVEREFAAWRPEANDKLDVALITAALSEGMRQAVHSAEPRIGPGKDEGGVADAGWDPWLATDGFRIGG